MCNFQKIHLLARTLPGSSIWSLFIILLFISVSPVNSSVVFPADLINANFTLESAQIDKTAKIDQFYNVSSVSDGEIIIRKSANKTHAMTNEPIKVSVDIIYKTRPANIIEIAEVIDQNFEINFYGYYTAKSLKDLIHKDDDKYTDYELIEDKYIKIIYMNLTDSYRSKKRITYDYTLLSKEPGIFSANTIVRAGGDFSKYSDVDFPLYIEVKDPNPEFNVEMVLTKLEVPKNEPFDVKYYITYLGGASDTINATVRCDNPPKEEYHEFEKNQNIVITRTYKYPDSGPHPIPEITICNTECEFEKSYGSWQEAITVTTWAQRNIDYLLLGVGILGIIIGQIYGSDIETFTKNMWNRIRKK